MTRSILYTQGTKKLCAKRSHQTGGIRLKNSPGSPSRQGALSDTRIVWAGEGESTHPYQELYTAQRVHVAIWYILGP